MFYSLIMAVGKLMELVLLAIAVVLVHQVKQVLSTSCAPNYSGLSINHAGWTGHMLKKKIP